MTHSRTRTRGFAMAATSVALMTLLGACAQDSVKDKAPTGTAADTEAGIEEADGELASWSAPLTDYPEEPALSAPVDLAGKTVHIVALGDQIPVIHGVAVGLQDALAEVGATGKICDGKFNPTAVADCLKTAGDQGADAVVSLFVDYEMAGTAFDALADKGVRSSSVASPPSGGREADDSLAFYDNTGRVDALYEAMSVSAVANGGAEAQMLWLKLMDSTTTRSASDKGIAKARRAVPDAVASPRPSSPRPTWTSCPRRSAQRSSRTPTPTCSSCRWTASCRPPSRACRARASATRSRSSPPARTSPDSSASRTASRSPTWAPRSSTRAGSTRTG